MRTLTIALLMGIGIGTCLADELRIQIATPHDCATIAIIASVGALSRQSERPAVFKYLPTQEMQQWGENTPNDGIYLDDQYTPSQRDQIELLMRSGWKDMDDYLAQPGLHAIISYDALQTEYFGICMAQLQHDQGQ